MKHSASALCTKDRRRGPLLMLLRSVESLPEEDVPLDVVDGEVDALARHKAEVAE